MICRTNRLVIATFLILFLVITACSRDPSKHTIVTFVQPTQFPNALVAEYFPLSIGSYWIYEGNVKWQSGSDVFEETMQWKMEVIEVVARNDIVGYRMLGAPWDMEFYQEEQQPSEFAFIKVGTGRIYESTIEQYLRMQDENDPLVDMLHDGSLFIDIPLLAGEKICDTFSITRPDGLYCKRVSETETELTNVIGVETITPMSAFVISQATGPDRSTFHFVPGVGITQFKYVHHGTISEVDVKLIEYYNGQ